MKLKPRRLVIIFILSIIITLLSFGVQRFGPEVGYLGADCRPDCVILKLNAGWPLPYVFDNMGVSVINLLHLEDEFRLAPFIMNIIIYAAVLFILSIATTRIRNAKNQKR